MNALRHLKRSQFSDKRNDKTRTKFQIIFLWSEKLLPRWELKLYWSEYLPLYVYQYYNIGLWSIWRRNGQNTKMCEKKEKKKTQKTCEKNKTSVPQSIAIVSHLNIQYTDVFDLKSRLSCCCCCSCSCSSSTNLTCRLVKSSRWNTNWTDVLLSIFILVGKSSHKTFDFSSPVDIFHVLFSKEYVFLLSHHTVSIREFDKLNLICQFDFRPEPIFTTSPAASKKHCHLQKWSKATQKWLSWFFYQGYTSLNPWYTL